MFGYLALVAMLSGNVFTALVAKHLFREKRIRRELSLVIWQYTLPFLIFAVIFAVRPRAPIPGLFWLFIFGALPFEVFGQFLQYRALKLSDISLVTPLGNLTPIFLLGIGYAVSGDVPSLSGIIGVTLIVSGLFFIGAGEKTASQLSAWRDRGARSMVGAALAFSVTSAFGRKAVQLTDPFTFGFFTLGLLIVGSFAALAARGRFPFGEWRKNPLLKTLGLGATGETFGQYIAYDIFPAAYVIALKRLSTLASVLWGGVVWHEPHVRRRLFAALVMIAGALLVLLGG